MKGRRESRAHVKLEWGVGQDEQNNNVVLEAGLSFRPSWQGESKC